MSERPHGKSHTDPRHSRRAPEPRPDHLRDGCGELLESFLLLWVCWQIWRAVPNWSGHFLHWAGGGRTFVAMDRDRLMPCSRGSRRDWSWTWRMHRWRQLALPRRAAIPGDGGFHSGPRRGAGRSAAADRWIPASTPRSSIEDRYQGPPGGIARDHHPRPRSAPALWKRTESAGGPRGSPSRLLPRVKAPTSGHSACST